MYPYFVWIFSPKNVSFVAENEIKLKELSWLEYKLQYC